jgi:hypothetical protein
MTNFSNGKVTSSVLFYRVGIPNSDKSFGTYASMNYEMLRQIQRYNRVKNARANKARQIYQFFK